MNDMTGAMRALRTTEVVALNLAEMTSGTGTESMKTHG